MLFQHVTKVLDDHGYGWCECRGCFDIAARKRDFILLKVLDNVDSLQESQATNMRILSERLDAIVALVGTHTRYERLDDDVIYERFSIPTFTVKTLDAILEKQFPDVYRNKGGMFAEISPSALRSARADAGLTQKQLADAVGVTKKSIYEHESRRMKAQHDVAVKIENVLHTNITIPFEPVPFESSTKTAPSVPFEHSVARMLNRLGFETRFVRQSPFNVIAEERVLVVSDAEPNVKKIERKAEQLAQFSEVSGKSVVVISDAEPRIDLPSITTKQLKNISAKGLRKLARK